MKFFKNFMYQPCAKKMKMKDVMFDTVLLLLREFSQPLSRICSLQCLKKNLLGIFPAQCEIRY